jgi:hypothetical protein
MYKKIILRECKKNRTWQIISYKIAFVTIVFACRVSAFPNRWPRVPRQNIVRRIRRSFMSYYVPLPHVYTYFYIYIYLMRETCERPRWEFLHGPIGFPLKTCGTVFTCLVTGHYVNYVLLYIVFTIFVHWWPGFFFFLYSATDIFNPSYRRQWTPFIGS